MAPRPLILDVDTGVDDALALLYAVASPEVELIGAACVTGNISVEQATEKTLAALEVAADECLERFVERVRSLVEARA
jgi:inosine-uridine nucleoside N-ribohydrolase